MSTTIIEEMKRCYEVLGAEKGYLQNITDLNCLRAQGYINNDTKSMYLTINKSMKSRYQ